MRMKELFPHLTENLFKKCYLTTVSKAKQVNPLAKTILDHDIRNEIRTACNKSKSIDKVAKVSISCLQTPPCVNSYADCKELVGASTEKVAQGNGAVQVVRAGVTQEIAGVKVTQKTIGSGATKDTRASQDTKEVCKFCGKKYDRIQMLINHIENIHKNPKARKSISCPKCPKALSSKKCLNAHMKIHEKELSKICHNCGLAFYSDFKLKVHVRNMHTEIVCGKNNCAFIGTATEVKKHRHSTHRSGPQSVNE